jgi:hypothetical protein
MDVAGGDGQRDISRSARLAGGRASALGRAELRDPYEPERDLDGSKGSG